MSGVQSPRRPRRSSTYRLGKRRGIIQQRVQEAGPDRFGIVAVDPAKRRSKWMMADFYGRVLREPAVVVHTADHIREMVAAVRQATEEHDLLDLIVVMEQSGNYHLILKRELQKADFEVRLVHPCMTRHLRVPVDPGNKTDETDLKAIHCAATHGFGQLEPELDPVSYQLRLLTRHRRDLVHKSSRLCCQIRESLDAIMPGYGSCFRSLWESPVPLFVARHFRHADLILKAGTEELEKFLRARKVRFHGSTLILIMEWARSAPQAASQTSIHHRIWTELEDDRQSKVKQIQAIEPEIASFFARSPYLVLLSIPGVNVVSAAEYAGELGPISHYPNSNAITGRAGLFPSRCQSDDRDHRDGAILSGANHRLRGAILQIAENLARCNDCFSARMRLWESQGRKWTPSLVKIGSQFVRISYPMVTNRELFDHPACRDRMYVLKKLLEFLKEHDVPPHQILRDLKNAVDQIPKSGYRTEAEPLLEIWHKHKQKNTRNGRSRRSNSVADILPEVLKRLGTGGVQSGDQGIETPALADQAAPE